MYSDVCQAKRQKYPLRLKKKKIYLSKNKLDFNFKLGRFGLGIIGECS